MHAFSLSSLSLNLKLGVAGALVLSACAAPIDPVELDGPEPYLALQSRGSVDDAVATSCGTASVAGLSEQLTAQLNCSGAATLVRVEHRNLRSDQAVFLQPQATSSLIAAIDARGVVMTVNSAYRTAAQQYLLYRWGQQGRCEIGTVAAPGGSNHQSGLAIDIVDPGAWRPALEARGFRWYGPTDAMHFDFVGGGTDLRQLSVLAFQQLWNLNHPEDRIAEDGAFGNETAVRLGRSPAAGFPTAPSCGVNAHGCTQPEEDACARFATQCVDHQCSGGFGEGHGCTQSEEQACARFGTQCVDHGCSGGFGEGHGCTAREERDCASFGTQCVDHQCSGGFGKGHGCTAREERDCASVATQCVDHQCSGGLSGRGTGCTAREQLDCDARGMGCYDHACTAR